MNMMKIALLGSAALATVTISARADDLSDLKAQIEALNSRVAQVEAAPAVPAGYQLLTVSEGKAIVIPGLEADKNYGDTATVISVLPTADAPAGTELSINGFARAALVFKDPAGSKNSDVDVKARGEVTVAGKTDTAVGEVGAKVVLRVNSDGYGDEAFSSPTHFGYWAITPELTLGGGYTGSVGNVGYGYDGACNCYYTDNADVGFNPGDVTQMRLSYASGPISFAIALEDATGEIQRNDDQEVNGFPAFGGDDNALGAAAEVKFSGDVFNGEISAVWHEGGSDFLFDEGDLTSAVNWDDSYQVGIGFGATFDMFKLSMAAAMGHIINGQDYWGVSMLASANMTDAVHAEIGFGHKNYDNNAEFSAKSDVTAVLAGIYYDPVSQLTIGLEGEYINPKGSKNNDVSVDLVTVYRF
jgi:hypothetical protein